nr:oligosaccharide repeat unit polymerase [Sphingomonas carotinifaciens]
MIDTSKPIVHRHLSLIYGAFVAATVLSLLYCVFTGQFNGDFFPSPVYLSSATLIFVSALCIAPYAFSWNIAGQFNKITPRHTYSVSFKALFLLFSITSLFHAVATLLFGVGIMDREVYTAPSAVMPFIQVLNRIDPFYLGAFFILSTPKRMSSDLFAVIVMVTIGLLRAGLGVFNYVAIAMCAKYSMEIIFAFRRAPWLIISGAMLLPVTIGKLYEFRSRLRGDVHLDLDLVDMLLGRFVGRLSSFSNVAYVVQNNQSFEWSAKALEPLFYVKQALSGVLGGVAPTMTPERLLIAGTQSYEGYSTFMTGVPGNLIMAWYVSPWVLIINLLSITTSICGILWLSRYFGNGIARVFGLGMLVYPLTSGVANEFALLLLNTIILLAFVIIFQNRTGNKNQNNV